MKIKLLTTSFLLLLLALTPAFGQAISGDVTGTITGPSGAVLTGASLTIQNGQPVVNEGTQS